MKKTVFIYSLSDPDTGEIRYIGKTNRPIQRLSAHICRAETLKNHCANWIRSLTKKGKRPVMEVIEESNEELWAEAEKRWIKHYRELGLNLTNFTDGGDKGTASYGRLGKKNSAEHIAKTRAGRLGKPVKRNKDSDQKRAECVRKFYDNNKKKVFQYSLDGTFVTEWECAKDAAQSLNCHPSNIHTSCQKLKRTCAGSQWRYEKYLSINKL